MSVDAQMTAAYAALQQKRYGEVLELVAPLDTPELRHLRPRLVARALAWRAQALMGQNAFEAARAAILEALRLARAGGEVDALPALRELHGQIAGSLAAMEEAQRRRAADKALLEMSEAEILGQGDADQVADLLTRQAMVLWEEGQGDLARQRIAQAVQMGQSPRARVLAGLGWARMEDPAQHLLAAWEVADAADDTNLIAAVAQAARTAGVTLPGPGAYGC